MELDGIHFDQMDRMVLEELRAAGGEIQVVVCRQGEDDELGCALHKHCLTMVERGYLEPIKVGGTRSRMQGAAQWATFRARAVALALLDLLQKAEAIDAELAELRGQTRPDIARSKVSRQSGGLARLRQ